MSLKSGSWCIGQFSLFKVCSLVIADMTGKRQTVLGLWYEFRCAWHVHGSPVNVEFSFPCLVCYADTQSNSSIYFYTTWLLYVHFCLTGPPDPDVIFMVHLSLWRVHALVLYVLSIDTLCYRSTYLVYIMLIRCAWLYGRTVLYCL